MHHQQHHRGGLTILRQKPIGAVRHLLRFVLVDLGSVRAGHIWQGRFKHFPIQEDEHLLTVLRYVERNPLRARLVRRAEDWHWGSLGAGRYAPAAAEAPPLATWPVPRPRKWIEIVNEPQTEAELEAIRVSIQRGRPFGDSSWQKRTAKQLGLESTFRPRGRPRKA